MPTMNYKQGSPLRLFVASFFIATVFSFAPLKNNNNQPVHHGTSSFCLYAGGAISPGDKVLVLGGTGGVGQLTIGKLQDLGGYNVCTATRNKSKAAEILCDDEVEIFQVDLLSEDTSALEVAMNDAAALVISVGTTAFPTPKWNGGNTPKAIDEEAVVRAAEIASNLSTMKVRGEKE